MKNLLFILGFTIALSMMAVSALEPIYLENYHNSTENTILSTQESDDEFMDCRFLGEKCEWIQINDTDGPSKVTIHSVSSNNIVLTDNGEAITGKRALSGILIFHYTAYIHGKDWLSHSYKLSLSGFATLSIKGDAAKDAQSQYLISMNKSATTIVNVTDDYLDLIESIMKELYKREYSTLLGAHVAQSLKSTNGRGLPILLPTYLNTTLLPFEYTKWPAQIATSISILNATTSDLSLIDVGGYENETRSVNGTLIFHFKLINAIYARTASWDVFSGVATLSVDGDAHKNEDSEYHVQLSRDSLNVTVSKDLESRIVEKLVKEIYEKFYVKALERHINRSLEIF